MVISNASALLRVARAQAGEAADFSPFRA